MLAHRLFAVLFAFSFSSFVSSIASFEQAHWQAQLALALTQLPSIIVALTPYPKVAGFAKQVLAVLNVFSFLAHKDSPGTLKLPFVQSQPPGVVGQPVAVAAGSPKGFAVPWLLVLLLVAALPWLLFTKWNDRRLARKWARRAHPALLAFFALLSVAVARPAHAQVVSYGLSLPMLEFQPNAVHPAAFAPGAGGQLTVGFFQTVINGSEWDLLDLSVAAFGDGVSSPNGALAGSFQVALTVGTLNNLFFAGAATPLYNAAGGGDFQGSFQVYPVLGVSIPLSFSGSAPTLTLQRVVPAGGQLAFPRGGTLYL